MSETDDIPTSSLVCVVVICAVSLPATWKEQPHFGGFFLGVAFVVGMFLVKRGFKL